MAPPETPLFAGSVLGLRAWEVNPQVPFASTRLTAAVRGGTWRPNGDWTRAFCAAGEAHDAPDGECSCGLYAFHPWRDAVARLFRAHRSGVVGEDENLTALGVIEAAGRLEIHRHGFRAERARPAALFADVAWGREIHAGLTELAELYGCELVEVRDAKSVVAYCEWRGGGLSRARVSELLKPVLDQPEAPDVPFRHSPALGQSVGPPAVPPAPPDPPAPTLWDRLASLGETVMTGVLAVILGLLGLVYYGVMVLIVIGIPGGLIFGWFDEEPTPLPAKVVSVTIDRERCRVGVELNAKQPVDRVIVRLAARLSDGRGIGHDEIALKDLPEGRSTRWPSELPKRLCASDHTFTVRARVAGAYGTVGRIATATSAPASDVRNGQPAATQRS